MRGNQGQSKKKGAARSRRKLSELLAEFKKSGRKAFIPFLMAGDPNFEATRLYLKALEEAGADAVELGVPFSDPNADGPVIQRAAERALAGGASLRKILDFIRRYRASGGHLPLILFSYYNPVLRMGLESFAREARRCGADAALIVDLPPEESKEYRSAMEREGVETIFLASPTTSDARLELIDACSTAFVYYISRLGVTGKRASLSGSLSEELRRVRPKLRRPVLIGFGISTAPQAREAAKISDGAIVGSALAQLSEGLRPPLAAKKIMRLGSAISRAIRGIPRNG